MTVTVTILSKDDNTTIAQITSGKTGDTLVVSDLESVRYKIVVSTP
jgi:hypothetical protein